METTVLPQILPEHADHFQDKYLRTNEDLEQTIASLTALSTLIPASLTDEYRTSIKARKAVVKDVDSIAGLNHQQRYSLFIYLY